MDEGVKEEVNYSFPDSNILKSFPKDSRKSKLLTVLATVLVVFMGVGSGWIFSGAFGGYSFRQEEESKAPNTKESQTEAGISDESLFESQTPEGILVEGGIEGEGTHHLERPGGPSQNVYLTSSVIDLQSFVGKKVRVWGNTLSGVKAGWLMEVGKIKVLE